MMKRVALITGGARGIGGAIAISLAEQGWDVAFCYRTSRPDAEATLAAIQKTGSRGLSQQCDISDPQSAETLVRNVETEWGRIDALINCAGSYHRANLLEESIEGWHEMFDNNLHPVFYLSRLVAPGMQRRHWGRIINFSMVNASQMIAQPNLTAHYIAKAGVLILTRTLAKVLASEGITANAVSPGFIKSNATAGSDLEETASKIPAGYLGSTADVVAVVSFLLSDDAKFVNGANIQLSGGWVL